MPQVANPSKSAGGDGSTLAAVLEKKNEQIPFDLLEEEKLPGSRARYKVKIGEEAFKPRLDDTFKEFSRHVRIEGFRPGKAPTSLVRRRFENEAREETGKRTLPRIINQLVATKGIEPLTDPYILTFNSTAADGTTIEFALEVTPHFELTADSFANLAVDAHKIRLDEEYVTSQLERIREQNASYEPTEDGYEANDGMLLTCTVTDTHGNVIDERSVTDYYTTKLEQEMPEAVAQALLGKKKGDTLSLDIAEEVEDAAPGTLETVHYDVKVQEVKKRVLPKLDDDFAKDVNAAYETVADLRKAVQDGAARNEENRERDEALNAIYAELRNRLDFDLPRAMVERTANRSVNDMERRLNEYGMSLRTMDQQIVRSYAAGVQEQAKVNVKNYLILKTATKFLNVTVSEDEITKALENIAKQSGRKPLAVRAQLEAKKQWDSFMEDLLHKVTNDQIVAKATVNYKEVSAKEFADAQKKAQETQAARLRGKQLTAQA